MLRGQKNNLNSHQLPQETENGTCAEKAIPFLSPMAMSAELVFWRDMIAATNSRLVAYFRPQEEYTVVCQPG